MAHELWVVRNGTMTNITPILGSINWKSNIDELGDELTFTLAYNDDLYFPQNVCDLGDLVIFKNGDYEITRAVIVEENKSGRNPIGYTAFDYAFYLDKSNAIYQFNKILADQAIFQLLKDFNVPLTHITAMPVLINKIYNNKKVSDIIKDIISIVQQSTGLNYLMEMRQGSFVIENQIESTIQGTFNLAENFTGYDVTHAIMSPSKKRSIVDMRNYIQVVSDEKWVMDVSNADLIYKYGRLQEVLDVDPKEKSKAGILAQNKLNELGKIFEESSVELPGDDRFRAGRLFTINEPITGLHGEYLIKDANHSISKGIHKMSLGMEEI